MKTITTHILIAILLIGTLSGCSTIKRVPAEFIGYDIHDLEDARSSGVMKTFTLPYDSTFDAMITHIKNSDLKIYQKNRAKGYIVVIDLYKQVNTTRVGIFFNSISENNTDVTLSSLSSGALEKVELLLFNQTTPGLVITE